MELKDVIRIRREELGLTLEQIAEACGVGKSIVSKWERGDVTNLRRDSLIALADVLRVSPLVLVGREDLDSKSDREVTLDDFSYALYGKARELTPENRQKLLEMAEFFKMQQDKDE